MIDRQVYYFEGSGIQGHTHTGSLFVEFLREVKETGYPLIGVNVLSRFDIKSPFTIWERYRYIRKRAGVPIYLLPSRLMCWFWCMQVYLNTIQNKRVIIHARKLGYADWALHIKKRFPDRVAVIADLEGAYAAEVEHLSKEDISSLESEEHLRLAYAMEQRVLRDSDSIFCVSQNLIDYFSVSYSVEKEKMQVFPTCFSSDLFVFDPPTRKTVRTEMKFDNETFVMTFSGGIYPWQLFPRIIEIVELIKQWEPKIHFLVLTKDVTIASQLLQSSKLSAKEYTIKNLNHESVGRYLNGCDLGFLIRENVTMNRVASPGKFAEYLACGVPLLLSDHIGDFSTQVRDQPYVILLKNNLDNSELESKFRSFRRTILTDEQRKDMNKWAVSHYAREKFLPIILKTYRSL